MTASIASTEIKSADTRSRRLLWAGVILLLALIAISVYLVNTLGRLKPGEVVDQYGTFVSPRGQYRITIREEPDGMVVIDVETNATRMWFFSKFVPAYSEHLDRERDWMLCFDEYDRLWFFRGSWPGEPGSSRPLPRGGQSLEQHSVQLAGWFRVDDRYTFGKTVVDQTNTWEGVPPEFFERLPPVSDPGWPSQSVIPQYPVPFSKSQIEELKGRN